MNDAIGKISATSSNPTSADEFCFWVKDNVVIAPFDMVAVENVNGSITVGIVEEIFHVTDSFNHIANYVSHDFGQLESAPTTSRLGTVYATAKVTNNTKDIYMPLRDSSVVRFASEGEIREALGINRIAEDKRVPAGFLSLSNDVSIPVHLDSSFLIGPEGAHLNVSGISGLATKTSYIMFLLQAISQSSQKDNTGIIVFNVKGKDLLYLDRSNPQMGDGTKEAWRKCELDAKPFEKVKYFMSYVNDSSRAYANTWCDNQTLTERQKNGQAFNYIYTYNNDKEKLDLLFSNVDDPNFTLEAIQNELISGRDFQGINDWDGLLQAVNLRCQSGQTQGSSIPVVSWRRFKRLLGTHVRNDKGIFQGSTSSNAAKCHVSLSSEIEKISRGDVYVIDIASVEEQEKCLVFGDVIRTIYKMKTEGKEDCPEKIVVFVDELNKYAPESVKSSPIIKDLLEITERGRSLGIILFSAEQFRSAVNSRVKGNCATNLYGRTNAVEIATSDYRYIPKTYANMMTRLDKGHLIIQHPIFRNLLKIKFPKPSYYQPEK